MVGQHSAECAMKGRPAHLLKAALGTNVREAGHAQDRGRAAPYRGS